MRFARLASLIVAIALTQGGVAGASPQIPAGVHAAYDFRDGVQPSYWTGAERRPLVATGTTEAATHTFGPGAALTARPVRRVLDGATLRLPPGSVPATGPWSLSMSVDPDDTAAVLADLGGGTLSTASDAVRWTPAGSSTPVHLGSLNPFAFNEITLEVGGTTLNVYVRGNALGSVPNAGVTRAPVLFGDGESRIARLRTFQGFADPAQLGELDTTAPVVPAGLIEPSWLVTQGGSQWVGPNSLWGWVDDDGTGPAGVELEARDAADAPLRAFTEVWTPEATASGLESIRTYWGDQGSALAGVLEHAATYKLAVRARDAAGNQSAPTSLTARWDEQAPTGLTAAFATETTDRTPVLHGRATVGPRDDEAVWVTVCTGVPCDAADEPDSNVVGFAGVTIGPGGTWSVEQLQRYVLEPGYPMVDVGALPVGTYNVEVEHADQLFNTSLLRRPLKIAGPVAPNGDAPATPPAVAPPTVASPLPPAPPSRRPRARHSARQLAGLLLSSTLRTLRRETPRSFVKDGATVPFGTDSLGTAIVRVYTGSARRKTLIASGRRVFTRVGPGAVNVRLTRAGKKALRRKKRVRVVARMTFVPRRGAPAALERRVLLDG